MPQLPSNDKCELVVFEMFDPMAGENQCVRLSEAKRGYWNVVILAHENQRHRNLKRCASALHDREDPRVLSFVNHHGRPDKPAARQRHVNHRDDDEERHLGHADLLVNKESDQQRRRKREEQR